MFLFQHETKFLKQTNIFRTFFAEFFSDMKLFSSCRRYFELRGSKFFFHYGKNLNLLGMKTQKKHRIFLAIYIVQTRSFNNLLLNFAPKTDECAKSATKFEETSENYRNLRKSKFFVEFNAKKENVYIKITFLRLLQL